MEEEGDGALVVWREMVIAFAGVVVLGGEFAVKPLVERVPAGGSKGEGEKEAEHAGDHAGERGVAERCEGGGHGFAALGYGAAGVKEARCFCI